MDMFPSTDDINLINSTHVETVCCSTSGEFVEILKFRHFARYMSFAPTGKQSKKKQILNGIDVSVVLHLV